MFTDAEFMSARDKELIYKAWIRFLKSGDWRKFTKRLYNHAIQHQGCIAHYNHRGFIGAYDGPGHTIWPYVREFLRGGEVRVRGYGEEWVEHVEGCGEGPEPVSHWRDDEDYGDINGAMAMVALEHADRLRSEWEFYGYTEEVRAFVKQAESLGVVLTAEQKAILNVGMAGENR